jgi:methyl-accepting chemotaxis protein
MKGVGPAPEKYARGSRAASRANLQPWVQRSSRFCAALDLVLAATVLGGWVLDVQFLKQMSPGFASMKVNTAIEFALLGVACWLASKDDGVRLRRSLALAVIAIAIATGLQDLLGTDWGIDQLLFRDDTGSAVPGRMAPVTALNFLLLGVGAFFVDTRRPFVAQAPVVLATIGSFLALLG